MLRAYIDESGDEGVSDKSSQWLNLGCIILNESDVEGVKTYLADGIAKVWKGMKAPAHVHFCKINSHSQRKALLNMVRGLNFTACVVCAKKSENPKPLKSPLQYNYSAKHLLERISWYGKDRGQIVNVTFATRSEESWEEFENYIAILRTRDDHQIKFGYLGSIRNSPASTNVALQAADWVTSGFSLGLNSDQFGNVETGYAEILWGKFWMRKGNIWSYGIKILPASIDRKDFVLLRKIDTWLEDPTALTGGC